MNVTRRDVENAKNLVRERLGARYVFGGMFDPNNLRQGTDCSGVWQDVLATALGRLIWGREAEGATTESYRPKTMGGQIPIGGTGPFGTIVVSRPQDIPADAVAKLAFHHGPGGGANSHMWGELDGMRIESASSKGLVTGATAWPIDHTYANAWAYLPGPIDEDGETPSSAEPPDTLYADVSEWQVPVTDAYTDAGYRVLCIRSNDGTYRDKDWANNYPWCKRAVDDGRLAFFMVYFVWRPNWRDAVSTLKSQVGQPHPKMAVMIDVESWGGQIRGDQSAGINAAFEEIAAWLGDRRRVIGYGNTGDLDSLWPTKPEGVCLVVAGYGKLPTYPGMIAHQYTDGQGYGGGLPEGAPPFGNCDMNAANGRTASAFANMLGIHTPTTGEDFMSALSVDEQRRLLTRIDQVWGALFNPIGSLSKYKTTGEGDIYTTKDLVRYIDKNLHEVLVEAAARDGNPEALALVKREADKGDRWAKIVYDHATTTGKSSIVVDNDAAVCALSGGACSLVAREQM
ncbi:glycoside hydrolase family 25 domain-containing protein [Mycobacteroides abscessus]|uniref:hypothetical protein n=1 Tax=Mycobacteroides abscessus TaxID=36809 RepID=UPI001F33C441|nr:hypothetical protein [Mycobacteroides abscessus]